MLISPIFKLDNLIIYFSKTLVLIVIHGNNVLKGLSVSEVNEELSGTLKPLMQNIMGRYFSQSRCICFITENNRDMLQHISHMLPIFHIHIGNKSNITYIEESEEYYMNLVSKDKNILENLLMNEMTKDCNPFIIQVNDPRSIIIRLDRVIRRSMSRYNKHYMFLPENIEYKSQQVLDFFSLEEINIMPDSIVARFVNITTVSLFKQHRGFRSKNNDISSNYLESVQDASCLSRNLYWNDISHAIEIVTHKFVGTTPSAEVVLDIWLKSNESEGFLHCNDLFPDKTENLEGKLIKFSAFHYIPFTLISENKKKTPYGGTEISIFLELAKKINFTWEIVTDDNLWGVAWSNGSGNGVIGIVAEGRADFGMSGIYPWLSTYQWVDFSRFYSSSCVLCMTPKPKVKPHWMTVYLPLSLGMWSALISSFFFVSVFGNALAKISSKYLKKSTPESFCTPVKSLLTTFGMLTLQAQPHPLDGRSGPMKCFVASILVFFLIISNVYVGGLASILTIPRSESPIDTAADLAASGLPWVNVHEAWIWSLLGSEDDVSKTLIQRFQIHTEQQMAAEVTQGKTAFSLEKFSSGQYSIPEFINEDSIHSLRVMKEMLYGNHLVIITRKSSPYLQKLNSIISNLYESGIVEYWESKVLRKFPSERLQIAITQSTAYHNNKVPTKLMVHHLHGAFILFCFGLTVAYFTFLFEIVTSKLRQQSMKSKIILKTVIDILKSDNNYKQ